MTGVATKLTGALWRPMMWAGAAALLTVPAVATRFTRDVAWSAGDFLVLGALLFGACALFELGARMSGHWAYRAGTGVALLTTALLVLVNGAVGFLGDEDNVANLMFLGVILIAAAGAALARFRAAGMARAMIAAAAAQAAAGVVGWTAGWASPGAAGIYEAVIGTGLFGTLWAVAAGLFHKAATDQATPKAE